MSDTINKLIKNKYLIIVLIGVIGIILLLFSSLNRNSEKVNYNNDSEYEAEYIQNLESRIKKIVSTISGVGECEVMINTTSTTESVYVKEKKKSSNATNYESEDSVLTMTDGKGNQYAVITKKILPQISGVIVACSGGENTKVKADVTKAVCTVLGIGSNNVCVIAKS